MNNLIMRAQSRAGSNFAERETQRSLAGGKSYIRPKVKYLKQTLLTLALLLSAVSGAWAQIAVTTKYLYFEVSQDGKSATMKCSDSPGDKYYDHTVYSPEWHGMDATAIQAITTVTVDASCADFAGTSLRGLFHNFWGLTTIEGLTNLNTANVTNMDDMFYLCENLQTLDLSGFNTAKVTSMSKMFNDCIKLTSLDLSGFNTANVEYMQDMFEQSGLTSINFSGWNTAKVGNMSGMFKDCKALTTLDLTSWDTGKVVYMDMMFNHCDIIETIYVSDGWSTASVSSGDGMFGGCEKLYEFNYKEVDQLKAIPIEQGGYLNYKAPGIDLVSTDGKTWSFADGKMPAGNVTLNVEYYTPAGLAWKQGETDVPETGVTACAGFPFTLPTLDNPNSLTGITYESSNTDVATVDASTGAVTIVEGASGSTTITAKYAGNDTYEDKTVSYTLTVTAPLTLTLASSDPEKGTVTVEGASSGGEAPAEETLLVTMTAGNQITYDPATATDVAEITTEGGTTLMDWIDSNFGPHISWLNYDTEDSNKGTLEVTAKPGYTITKVVFSGENEYGVSESYEVTASPFAVYPWESRVYNSDSYNTTIGGIQGVSEIKVYGYEGSAASSVKPTEKEGEYIVIPNSEITLKATANDGYHIASWSNEAEVNDVLEATQTLVITEALNITANFAANPIITLASSDAGTVTVEGAGGGSEASESETIAVGNESYKGEFSGDHFVITTFAGSGSDGRPIGGSSNEIFEVNSKNGEIITSIELSVTEVYNWDGYTIGSTSGTTNGTYAAGSTVTIFGINATSATLSRTGTGNANGVVYINSAKIYYSNSSNIKDLGDGKYSVVPGTEITLKATASDGHYVKGWKVGQTDVTEGVTYDDYYDAEAERMPATSTLTLTITATADITAVFDEMSYIISPAEGTDDDDNWKGAVGSATATELPLEGVKKGETVNVTYAGTKKVIGLKAKKKGEAPEGLDVAWNYATKSGSFTSPAGDVTLTPVYAPVAAFDLREGSDDKLPEAVEDIYAGSTDAIVTAGSCAQGTLMYAVGTSATEAPALTAFSSTLPTAETIADGGDVYVWYYIKGADAPEGEEPTAENTFNDSEISAEPVTVTLLSNKFDITLSAANGLTFESGAGTVSVKEGTGEAVDKTSTIAEGKLAGVKMDSEVKLTAKPGYKFRKVEAKKKVTLVFPIALSEVTSDYAGSVVTNNGNVYATVADATAASETAAAMIVSVSSTGHGIAIALADESSPMTQANAATACSSKAGVVGNAWHLGSVSEWQQMFAAFGGDAAKCGGLITALANAGGSGFAPSTEYWTSDVDGAYCNEVWFLSSGEGVNTNISVNVSEQFKVRAVLAF